MHPPAKVACVPTPSPLDSPLGAKKDSISHCTYLQMTYTAENPHADGRAAPGARPRFRPPRRRDPNPRQQDGGKTNVLSSANGPSTVALQQRCHRTSASASSPSWPPMPGPRLQRAVTAQRESVLFIGTQFSILYTLPKRRFSSPLRNRIVAFPF